MLATNSMPVLPSSRPNNLILNIDSADNHVIEGAAGAVQVDSNLTP